MDAQPLSLPEWASVNPTGIVEPDESKKQLGWEGTHITPNEKPRFQYENWRAHLVYLWLKWIKDKINFGLDFDAPYVKLTYNGNDQVTIIDYYDDSLMTTHLAQLTLTYDADDRVATAALEVIGSNTYTATIAYDTDDKVTSISTVES